MTRAMDSTAPSQPLRKSAQRLRWFVAAFRAEAERVTAETGIAYEIDDSALAQAFGDWLKLTQARKPARPDAKPAFVGFAAGLMLQTLLRIAPAQGRIPADPAAADPAHFWPEGYLAISFCLTVRGQVIEADFEGRQEPGSALSDLRSWWSFKENVARDPALALAFLDLFAGEDPHWSLPEVFDATPPIRSLES